MVFLDEVIQSRGLQSGLRSVPEFGIPKKASQVHLLIFDHRESGCDDAVGENGGQASREQAVAVVDV